MKGCRSCRNWVGNGERLDRDDPAAVNTKVELGDCRRHAPQPFSVESKAGEATANGTDIRIQGVWPTVPSDAWCGDWEPEFKS